MTHKLRVMVVALAAVSTFVLGITPAALAGSKYDHGRHHRHGQDNDTAVASGGDGGNGGIGADVCVIAVCVKDVPILSSEDDGDHPSGHANGGDGGDAFASAD